MLFHGMLIDQAERTPDKEAYHWVDRGRGRTYAEAVDTMGRVAAALADVGVGPGDRVTIIGHNGLDYLDAMYGCWHLGAIAALVNVNLAAEFEYYLGDHRPAAVVFTHDVAEALGRAIAALGISPALICLDGPLDDALGLPELVAADLPRPPVAADESAVAHLSYTSGTTGRPKGACLAHEPTLTAVRCIAERLRFTSADRGFAPGAMSSSNPLVINILPMVAVGASFDVMGRWTPAGGYRAVVDRGATVFAANPGILADLLAEAVADESRALATTLRMSVSGGGAVPPRLRAAWSDELGIPLVESYGQSEIGGFFALGYPALRDDLDPRVGPALPDKEVRILGPDDQPLPLGEVGQICLRGGTMRGYWGKPEKTAETLANGWLHSGDLGSMDADGWITLRARSAELIHHAGQSWYPRDVEEALLAQQGVRAAALVGPERDGVRVPVAVVVVDGAEPAALLAAAGELVGRSLDAVELVVRDELPMTPTGKIAKAALAAELSG